MTKIMECTPQCNHKYQDETYKGKRVFVRTTQQEGKLFRCSVCGREKSSGESADAEKKKK